MEKNSRPRNESLLMVLGLSLFLAAACSKNVPPHHEATTPDQPTETSQTANEGDEAIQLVKHMIDNQGGLTASLSLPFAVSSMRFASCSPQEAEADRSANPNNPELWRCKSQSGGPPFEKQVTATTTQCCKTQTATIRSGDISNWRAEDADDDKQRVSADYAVLGQSHHSVWLVDTRSQKIGPQGDS